MINGTVLVGIDGKTPRPFVLDTGAADSGFNTEYAMAEGIELTELKRSDMGSFGVGGLHSVQLYQGGEGSMGPLRFKVQPSPVSEVDQRKSVHFPLRYGTIGNDLLEWLKPVLDFPNAKLILTLPSE